MRTANRQTPTQWTAAWLLLGAAALPPTPQELEAVDAQLRQDDASSPGSEEPSGETSGEPQPPPAAGD